VDHELTALPANPGSLDLTEITSSASYGFGFMAHELVHRLHELIQAPRANPGSTSSLFMAHKLVHRLTVHRLHELIQALRDTVHGPHPFFEVSILGTETPLFGKFFCKFGAYGPKIP
jgi:hypothetical protein